MNETHPQRRIWSMNTLWLFAGLCVLNLPLESTVQAENQLTALYNACATSALDGSLGQILDISFDITPKAHTGSSSENQNISSMDGNGNGNSNVEYSSCHVRVLHEGIIQTLHFSIVSTGDITALTPQPQYSDGIKPSSLVVSTGTSAQTTSADSIIITGEPLSREIVRTQPSLSPFADEPEAVTPVETATTATQTALTDTATNTQSLEKHRTFYFSE